MIIKTKYEINQELYVISNAVHNEFYICPYRAIIYKISIDKDNNIYYKLQFTGFNSFTTISEDKIDDLYNGYYFTTRDLASEACNIANK